ncbi:MAG TPA: anhydro-N-acetylmuramic acid kinase [Puia sp.]|nr:anhydro-N-acetylmuramic acid kinase [Puia sp.]
MVYKVIGLMSGSSLDGLDIAFAQFQETEKKWKYGFIQTACYPFSPEWLEKLANATHLSAKDYLLLHAEFGHYIGSQVKRFIDENGLQYQVQLIASHGHTTFHVPQKKMTGQLGDGAAIAASTGINVISDLRAMDIALGGQGAPIVPIGEKLLLDEYDFFLNLGGIANISSHLNSDLESPRFIAFDICPANRVLNLIANQTGKRYDEDGQMAAKGNIDQDLLNQLNQLEYYGLPYPKSLANDFGIEVVFPMIQKRSLTNSDALRTYAEHICEQVKNAILTVSSRSKKVENNKAAGEQRRMLVTGGGAHNLFLMDRLKLVLRSIDVELSAPDDQLIDFKEALVMALMGVLRWRDEINVLSSVTGAGRNSIGGAVWIGQE